jgi:hypothetical protein
MMLDYFDSTGDAEWARSVMLPIARGVVRFFDEHWNRDENGKIRFDPAASLETWHVAVNPMAEIVGLRTILPRLLVLPEAIANSGDRARWRRMLDEVPEAPKGEREGREILLPAEEFSVEKNMENPALYAVFPYRMYGVGRPDLEIARRTYATRGQRQNFGWCQDSIQAAYLGLAKDARSLLVKRARTKHAGSRFPAFWGPNHDWIPDQDHGANILMTLHAMLMQTVDDKILLLPAWPADWDVDFKLHANRGTVVEAQVRGGKVVHLKVEPQEERRRVCVLSESDHSDRFESHRHTQQDQQALEVG